MASKLISKPPPGARVDWGNPINDGLIGWWLFNEGAGGSVQNVAGDNIGVTVNANPVNWVGSPQGGTIDFDGTDDYINIGDALLTLSGQTGFAASMWVNPDVINFTDHRGILARGASATRTPWIWGPSGGNFIRMNLETTLGVIDVSSAALTIGVWTHLVFSWDGDLCTVYKDGIAGDTDTLGGALESQDADAAIGLIVGFAEWDGPLENIAVWNRPVTVSEVGTLHRNPYGGILRRRLYFTEAAAAAAFIPDNRFRRFASLLAQ